MVQAQYVVRIVVYSHVVEPGTVSVCVWLSDVAPNDSEDCPQVMRSELLIWVQDTLERVCLSSSSTQVRDGYVWGIFSFYIHRELAVEELSLIHISEPTRQAEISYAVFC